MSTQLTALARKVDVLCGTGIGDSLVGSTNELRQAKNEYRIDYRSRDGVKDRENEQERNRRLTQGESRRAQLQQQIVEMDGDDSLSDEKKLERIEFVMNHDSKVEQYLEKHGFD